MSVVFRFDDSMKNTFDVAYPEFKRRGWKAVLGLITGHVGGVWPDPPYRDKPQMTLEELRMLKGEGWEILSHSVTHPRLNELTEEQATREIVDSKNWIVQNLGVEPSTFIIPFGIEKAEYDYIIRRNYKFEGVTDYGLWSPPATRIPIGDLSLISSAKNLRRALVLLFHSILEGGEVWETTPEQFISVLDQVQASGLKVQTISEAAATLVEVRPTLFDTLWDTFTLVNPVFLPVPPKPPQPPRLPFET